MQTSTTSRLQKWPWCSFTRYCIPTTQSKAPTPQVIFVVEGRYTGHQTASPVILNLIHQQLWTLFLSRLPAVKLNWMHVDQFQGDNHLHRRHICANKKAQHPSNTYMGKGWPLGSRLWCLLWVCHFPIGILGQVWYLILSIPDLCTLTYFDTKLCRLMRQKQCAYWREKKTRKEKHWRRYKDLQRRAQNTSRQTEKTYLQKVVSEDLDKNPRRFWSYIKGRKQEKEGCHL